VDVGFYELKEICKRISVEPVSIADWHGSCSFRKGRDKGGA